MRGDRDIVSVVGLAAVWAPVSGPQLLVAVRYGAVARGGISRLEGVNRSANWWQSGGAKRGH